MWIIIISVKGMLNFLTFYIHAPQTNTHTHIHTHSHYHQHICVCVSVWVLSSRWMPQSDQQCYTFLPCHTLETSVHVILFYKAEVLFLCFPVSFCLDLANLASHNISLENYIVLSDATESSTAVSSRQRLVKCICP